MKTAKSKSAKNKGEVSKYVFIIPFIVLLAKILIIFKIPSGVWYGSDTESYIDGANSLLNDGLFSSNTKVTYLPAGYSIFIALMGKISVAHFSYLVSIVQSIIFSFAIFYLTWELAKTNLKKLAPVTSMIISLNLTLSLASMVIGYESLIASSLATAAALLLTSFRKEVKKFKLMWSSIGILCISLASFLQPRYILVGIAFIIIATRTVDGLATKLFASALGLLILISFPASLAWRNNIAIGKPVISYNLGATMSIGAGSETHGGFTRTGPEVPCQTAELDQISKDSKVVKCVLNWYIHNPIKTLHLSFNKSLYFWSPWVGIAAEGTMLRNPWTDWSPIVKMMDNPETRGFVLGPVGKGISMLWIAGQILLFFYGFIVMRKLGGVVLDLAWISFVSVLLSWLTSIGTIGDHRFRIPTMVFSLMFQAFALLEIRNKYIKAL